MRLSDRTALALLFCATAVASAAGVLALEHYGLVHIAPTYETLPVTASGGLGPSAPTQQTLTDAEPEPYEPRFAFLPEASVTDQLGPAQGEPLPPDMSASENPDAWTVESRPEPNAPLGAPRLAAPRSQPLPWQTPAAGTPPVKTYTLAERLAEISPGATKRLAEKFADAKASWQPAEMGLVAIKDEKILELYARPKGGSWTRIHRYTVLAASGVAGPKLRQGDKQVPEGVYAISFLNPNSRYHVSMRVNYPNAFDRQMAEKDGRKQLGGDIMIHGKSVSIGCLAVGDEAAEELFVLASNLGLSNVKLIIAPTDFRRESMPELEPGQPQWLPSLYTEVASAMTEFKAPPSTGLLSFFGN